MIGHVIAATSASKGFSGLGAIDTVIVLWFARVIGARFSDIGWPAWIGLSFVLVTMVLLPLLVVGYAIANNLPPNKFMELMGGLGAFTAAANLLLAIVAGTFPGRERIDPPAAVKAVDPNLPLPMRLAYDVAVSTGGAGRDLVMVIGVVGFVAIVAFGLIAIFNGPANTPSALQPRASAPAVPPPNMSVVGSQIQGNGLTKNTNDFLRQFSKMPQPAR